MSDTAPVAASEASVFSADQYADNYPAGIENHYWALARGWIVADALKEARRAGLWNGPDAILEIGCGPGVVVRQLRAQGFDAWGVELGRPAVMPEVASHIRVGQDANALEAAFRERTGAILLLDVIEHIAEPEAFLAKIAASFPNCRVFIVTVPARQEVWSNYDAHYGHHRRYDRPLLARSLRAAGLEPLRLRYFFRPLYPAALFFTLTRRPRPVVWRSPAHPRLHNAFARVLYGVERLLRPFAVLPGLSLLAIAAAGGRRDPRQ